MKKSLLAVLFASALSFNVHSLEPGGYNTDGGVLITPLLETGIKSDDNIFSQEIGEESSSIFTIAPSVNFLLDDGVNQYEYDLGIESATYNSSSADDYLTGHLLFNAHLEPSSQSRWDLAADIRNETEPRGTGLTENDPNGVTEPLEYTAQTAAITYEYGALSSKGRVAFDAKYYKKGFNNFTAITQFRDFDSIMFGGGFYYSNNSKTDTFLELNQTEISYDVVQSSIARDSDDSYALLGVQWEASALTSGSIRVGHQNKDFKDSQREDFSGLSWTIGVDWEPLSYSAISLYSARNARDPDIEGDYIQETVFSITWKHDWSERLSSSLGLISTDADYTGVGVDRADDTQTIDLSFDYAALRWMDVSFFIQLMDKDSTRSELEFGKRIVGVNFVMSL